MISAKIISRLAFVAGILILAMFLITVTTGVSQEKFEITQTVADYTRSLIAEQNPLRLIFTIDLVFITIFTTLFVILPQYLKNGDRISSALANAAIGAMLVCGFLDYVEDLHILTMLHSAVKGIPIEQNQIAAQMFVSMLKFCASYLSLFLLAFILPGETLPEKILKYSLLFVQLPVGALVYTAPENLHLAFNLARFAFMVAGFFLLGFIFMKKDSSPARA